ncbi:MAG TPA: acyl-CoA synthetase FdrA, partial [Burkholderiales bacterium]|nr:acyl-CoA synthetase FdrA [Burkholderiales bacterium]
FNRVERARYLDSVALMRLSRSLSALPGVEAAALMIGTPANKALLREAGLLAAEGEEAGPNDLVIAVRASEERAGQGAVASALQFLEKKDDSSPRTGPKAKTLAGALELLPEANLALISVPGDFAAQEARKALDAGLSALVFSSGVPLEEEHALKRLANEKGLLLMGPDCGTALLAGVPLAFANAVPRGDIGIVSASGTGLQEVSCLVSRLGAGVSHGIGVGGRDLDERVGALGTLAAIDALERDAGTRVIVLLSKPPAPRAAEAVLERLARCAKRSVVCFLGLEKPGLARTLHEAAEMATGKKIECAEKEIRRVLGRVEALYCGGTLCSEAELIFRRRGLHGYRVVDLGDDRYTRARPHPMIDPELRNEHVARALADPEVGVLLVDIVLGYGAHPDPAGVLLKENLSSKAVVASVVGTDRDPQVRSHQVERLNAAGVLVAPSNALAAEWAASLSGY